MYIGDSEVTATVATPSFGDPFIVSSTAPVTALAGMGWLDTSTSEVKVYDGSTWLAVKAGAGKTVNIQSVDFGATGTGIGAAYTAWAGTPTNKITGNVVIASWGTPAKSYILTDELAPGTDASWTSLGSAMSFATASEIHAGTDTTKAINAAILRGETLNAPSATSGSPSAADADKLIRLNSAGQIASKFLPATPTHVKGALDVTVAPTGTPPTYISGDILFASKAGTVNAAYPGAATQAINSGDALLFDGTNWHVLPNETDLNAYLALAGGTMADAAKITFNTTTAAGTTGGAASQVIIDGANGSIENCVVDCGGY